MPLLHHGDNPENPHGFSKPPLEGSVAPSENHWFKQRWNSVRLLGLKQEDSAMRCLRAI